MRNFILSNFPFLENDFDAMTDYELFCKMVEYMQNAVNQLSAYDKKFIEFNNRLTEIENYINTLDIQDAVNEKLDEMYEDGQLADLISQFIELQVRYEYDTVADLKLAENLVVGSYAHTNGYATINDGGAAYYKVRGVLNDDVIDDKFIIALSDNTLVAVLQYVNSININQINGADSDIGSLINTCIGKGITTFEFEPIEYECETTIEYNNIKVTFNFHNASVNCSADKMFDITCDNVHKSTINDLKTTGDDTNIFIELTPVSRWGTGIIMNNCEIRRYDKQLYGKSMFNSIINDCQFISDNGYILIENSDSSSGNMSNCNVFNNCYIRNRTDDTSNDPDYKIILSGVKNMTFNSCAFGRCKTVFNLTSCTDIELNNCQVESATAVSNTRTGLINNTNNTLIYTTKYAASDTYKSIPSRTMTFETIQVGSATNTNVRSAVLNDTTQVEYGSSAYNDNNTYAALTRYSNKGIKNYIPVNIIENHNESAGTTLSTDISSIFSSQRGEATMLDVYTRIYSPDASQKWFKDTFVLIDGSSTAARMRHMTQVDLGSTTVFSGSVIKSDSTVTNAISPTTLTTTSSVSCMIDVRIEFKKLGKSYQTS